MLEADLIGVDHGAAGIEGPAITVEPDHIDVARTRRDLFLEDSRALVDHRIHHALENFVIADHAALAPEPLQGFIDQLLYFRIGQRRARAGLVLVIALAGLLAEASGFAQGVGNLRLDAAVLARAPADIEAGEVAHRE